MKNRRAVRARRLLALLFLVAPGLVRAEPPLYAEQITARNLEARRVRGSDAIAGIGDWALGNGTLCAVVSDPEHEAGLSDRGGTLIDLGRCDLAHDQLTLLQPLLNLSRGQVLPVSEIEADVTGGEARLGELFFGRQGVLSIGIRAAPWVPVSEARIYTNGALTQRLSAQAGERLEVPMRFERDSFVTVEVEGEPSRVYAALAPHSRPFAFSNPIFVDADGDGRFTAPGLPSPLPETIAKPLLE